MMFSAVLTQYTNVTDDGQTDGLWLMASTAHTHCCAIKMFVLDTVS